MYEKIEIVRHTAIPIVPYHSVIRGFKKHNAEKAAAITQVAIAIRYIRFKVTTCLYLNPNNRARSLSTLSSVKVATDTPHKIQPVIKVITDR